VSAKEEGNNSTNLALIVESTHASYEAESNDMTTPHDLDPTVILYTVNQLVDSQLWDSNFCSISIFGMDKY